MPYETFIAERQAIVNARQRVEQRFEQLVTGGAAGALVFSATFLDKFAGQTPTRTWLLAGAWIAFLVSLLFSLVAQLYSRKAFDCFLEEFDRAFEEGRRCADVNGPARTARRLGLWSAGIFLVGVALLAGFAFANLP